MSALLAYPLSLKNLPGKRILNFYIFLQCYLMVDWFLHISCIQEFSISITHCLHILCRDFWWVPWMLCWFVHSLQPVFRMHFWSSSDWRCKSIPDFFKIVLPLGKPILIAMGLLSGLGYWNDWTNGLYYIRDTKLYGIQNLLNKMISDLTALTQNASGASTVAIADIPSASVRMAIAFVAMLPILCLYPFLQRYFTKGIALGAVKGWRCFEGKVDYFPVNI